MSDGSGVLDRVECNLQETFGRCLLFDLSVDYRRWRRLRLLIVHCWSLLRVPEMKEMKEMKESTLAMVLTVTRYPSRIQRGSETSSVRDPGALELELVMPTSLPPWQSKTMPLLGHSLSHTPYHTLQ